MEGQMSLFDYITEKTPKETPKICRNCSHMNRSTCGPDGIYHGFHCFGFGVSRSENLNQKACGDYNPATDGEAWRTDDDAAQKWIGF